ncbi:MAG: hypothetical protein IJP37_04755 [Clostridia bacterium]|nr:hypothetical protein [Clostridia bacterium]
MAGVITIAGVSCAALIELVLVKPSVNIKGKSLSIYWVAPFIGAIILLLFGIITAPEMTAGLTKSGDVNPIKILILFLSMTVISIFLDNAGFFRYLASAVLKKAKSSQMSLFVSLYVMVSVLTVFTSNDIIVLTFTPFICYFAKSAKIDPIPYLICEFIAANTWSMALMIGNPTNIYLAANAGVNFMEYIRVMLLPTLLAGGVSFFVLWLLFRKRLEKEMTPSTEDVRIEDKSLVAAGLIHLALCIVLMSISSYADLPMWIIALVFCASLLVFAAAHLLFKHRKMDILSATFKRAPWDVIPFVLSMFVLVLAFEKCGVTAKIADLLSGGNAVLTFGATSFLSANLINNIPMSVLFSAIAGSVPAAQQTAALYASIVGSNLGAFLTPMGALAGIMWMGLLKTQGVKLSFLQFIKYGALVAVPALGAALIGLQIML